MKHIILYFLLELKKITLQLPKLFAGSLLLLAVTSACLFLFHSSVSEKEKSTPVSIGVLAKKEEPFIDWIIKTANNMPDLGYSFQVSRIDEKTAENFLSDDRNVLFLVPKDYIASIISGKNEHLTIRFSKSQTTMVNTLMKELASAASSYILDTEAAIYSMQDYYKKYGLPDAGKEELVLNIRYVQEIINFTGAVSEKSPDPESSPSLAASCLSSGMVLFPLIFSLLFAPAMTSESSSLKKQLSRLGLHPWKQILAKEFSFLLAMFPLLCVPALILLFLKIADISLTRDFFQAVPLLLKPAGSILLLFQCIPVLFFAVSFSLFLYELAGDCLGGIFLLFFSSVFMSLFSGLFYPVTYLPWFFRKISVFSPLTHGKDFVNHILYRRAAPGDLCFLLLSGAGFYLLTLLICQKGKKFI